MSPISNLEPRLVWSIFEEITRVPRPSKKEGKIIKYLQDFAVRHDLPCKTDAAGNVLITREASPSMKDRPTVVLQSHMDMVCEKNSDVAFDFDNEPIRPVIVDGWIKAEGTTLGADDGIGMAAALAVLVDKSLEVPAIEALFTVDEETGLTGAFELAPDMLTGKYLINLDSEDEGEIFIGCAGGIDTLVTFDYNEEPAPEGHPFFRVEISGLKGGHSGDDIDKGLGNSNKLLARLLRSISRQCDGRVYRMDGGNLRNAIPREAWGEFCVPVSHVKEMLTIFEKFVSDARSELKYTEPGLDVIISEIPAHASVIDSDTQWRLLDALHGVPNGVLGMSMAMPGLVETSTNLASVKFKENGTILVTTSQRSSVGSALENAATIVESVFEMAGGRVVHSDGYPGWSPDPSSRLLEVTRQCYRDLFDTEPVVRAIHAGLECGLFLKKYPDLEMVSFGPTLRGVHSPDERMEISTVDKFWKLLIATLQNI